MVPLDCAVVDSPATFKLSAPIQEKVVPTTFAPRVKPTDCPLQIFNVEALCMTGRGLTVTVTVCAVPTHPFAEGVTVYITG